MNKIPGYIYDGEVTLLCDEAAKVPWNGIVVEIGSYLGKSTAALASAVGSGVTVHAIDTWDNRAMGYDAPRDTYADFIENTKEYSSIIKPVRGESKEISKIWEKPIDLLFIDADHSYQGAFSDLFMWAPLLNKGATLLMHDYTEPGCGVMQAFEEYSQVHLSYKSKSVVMSTLVVRL